MTGSPLSSKLVAFKVTHLGDTLLFLPVLQTLLARRPDLKALVFTTPLAAPLFAGCGVDDLIEVPWREFRRAPWRHPFQWWRWRSTVRRYAGGLALIGPEQGSTAHLLARAAQPGACVAWARTPARVRRSASSFTPPA